MASHGWFQAGQKLSQPDLSLPRCAKRSYILSASTYANYAALCVSRSFKNEQDKVDNDARRARPRHLMIQKRSLDEKQGGLCLLP